jgi:hypothetical protein
MAYACAQVLDSQELAKSMFDLQAMAGRLFRITLQPTAGAGSSNDIRASSSALTASFQVPPELLQPAGSLTDRDMASAVVCPMFINRDVKGIISLEMPDASCSPVPGVIQAGRNLTVSMPPWVFRPTATTTTAGNNSSSNSSAPAMQADLLLALMGGWAIAAGNTTAARPPPSRRPSPSPSPRPRRSPNYPSSPDYPSSPAYAYGSRRMALHLQQQQQQESGTSRARALAGAADQCAGASLSNPLEDPAAKIARCGTGWPLHAR